MQDVKFKGIAITEEDRSFSESFKDVGEFSAMIPLPFEKSSIFTAVSRAIGGVDYKSLPVNDYEYIRMVVTLNSVIKDKPPWWDGADKCPDDDFLNKLWRWYLDCEDEFTARLKSKTKRKNMETPK